jgi:hypothetical protein
MSTKTLRKRIALVAVSALGFGLVSSVPAMAAYPATSALTLGWSSVTVVDADTTDNNGYFYADTSNMALSTSTSTTRARLVAGETIDVTVISAPTGRSVADLNINSVTNAGSAIDTPFAQPTNSTDDDEDIRVTGAANDTHGNSNNTVSTTSTTTVGNETNRYWFAVNTSETATIGAGEYTLRVRLTNAEAEVKDYTVKVKFVAAIADAGAVLTLANSGSITTGAAYARTANTSTTATLRDANGGRVQVGQVITGTRVGWAPTLNAALVTDTGATEALTIADSGVTAVDHVACATGGAAACGTTGTTSANQTLNAAVNAAADGVYGVTDASISTAASSTTSVRVRISNTNVSASIAVPVIVATTAVLTGSTVRLAATGIAAADTDFRAITISGVAGSISYALPVAATTATLTVDAGTTTTAGQALTATTTWGGNFATASVTPASANVQTVFTDASGRVVIALTNSAPVAGATASVSIVGFADATEKLTISLAWAAATVDSLTILDPAPGIYAKTKSATVFSVEADDQFGNPIAGAQITPSLSSTSANYSATTTYAPVTTGANGVATWTLTDAAATDILGDSITFTSVVGGKTAAYSLTYKATLPAASSLTAFSATGNAAAADVASRGTSISSSGLTGTLVIARDISKSLAAFADGAADDMYAIRIRAVTSTGAAATGAPVTLTSSTGAWMQDVAGLPATSSTVAADANGDAYFRILATATGRLTFTATSGTATFAFPLTIADQTAAAGRFVTLTGGTTGNSNGDGIPMTATVTDRYGNGVSGVTLVVTASGVGAFMGGQTSQSFTTDATGRYTFLATSYNAAGGAATYSVNASNATDATSIAARSGSTVIDSAVKAGNQSATATVTFAAGENPAQAAAQAANDAAAEATDAANAATDAANAAAEAADAATAAAQDAADAVAALSTQVSEMVNALKKQITSLTNLVIKIQKKVRA